MPGTETASPLTFDIERSGETTVVRLHGKLIAGVGDVFYSKIKALIPDSKRIVLDMADLERMDSIGLGAVVRLYVSGRSAGCSVELMNIGKPVRDLLGVTHLLSVLSIIGENGIRLG